MSLMGALGGIVGGGLMDTITGGAKQDRARADYRYQLEQQKDQQKEMAEFMKNLEMEKWEETNFLAQREQLEKAGLSAGLMYGGLGQGGSSQTAGGGNASGTYDIGNQEAHAVATMNAMADVELKKAQAENLNADTENKLGGTKENLAEDARTKKFDNDMRESMQSQIASSRYAEMDEKIISAEQKNAAWEMQKAIDYTNEKGEHGFTRLDTRAARARVAELKTLEEEYRIARANGDVQEAESIIRDFEAMLAKNGIPRNSPFGVKLLVDWLEKLGVNAVGRESQNIIKSQITK